MMNKRGPGTVLNILSVVMLGLTALVCLCYTTLFFVPGLAGPFAGARRVSAVILPTATPTSMFPATWTPEPTTPPEDTPTPFVVNTEEPTEVRPTITLLPTRTKAPTPGPSPTPSPTRSIYPFTAQVTYQPSPIQPCGASYILGTIMDLEGKPVTDKSVMIHVEGGGDIDTGGALHPGEHFRGTRVEGRSPFMGLLNDSSAWDVVINQAGTSEGTWIVWLIQGRQISDKIEVRLSNDCAESAAIVRFQQNHELQ
jgi:hypothetical protein